MKRILNSKTLLSVTYVATDKVSKKDVLMCTEFIAISGLTPIDQLFREIQQKFLERITGIQMLISADQLQITAEAALRRAEHRLPPFFTHSFYAYAIRTSDGDRERWISKQVHD